MIRINKKSFLQYALLYFLMLLNQSLLMDAFGSGLLNYVILFGCICAFLQNHAYRSRYVLSFGLWSLLIIVIVRAFVGGVGLTVWTKWMISLMLLSITYEICPEKFLTRIVRLVSFFAAVSLVFWGLSFVNEELVKKLMLFSYDQRGNQARYYLDAVHYYTIPYRAYGGLLYGVNMTHPTRNCGIFTEPGIYQIPLISAVYVILYLKNDLQLSMREQKVYLPVLILTIVSTQSTSAYLSLIAIFLPFAFCRHDRRIRYILGLALIGAAALAADLWVRGSDSLVFRTIVMKLFRDGKFTLEASSGAARTGTMLECTRIMLQHPLGVGYDRAVQILNPEKTGFVAASVFMSGAACGIPMFLLLMWFLFSPILRSDRLGVLQKAALAFAVMNSLLAQSNEFYPYLAFLPFYLYMVQKNRRTHVAIRMAPGAGRL